MSRHRRHTHKLWAVHLHTHTLTLTGQTRLIYVSHAGHNLTVFRPTVEAINADVCFCIDIPELTSCFPQTQNATAMCVCAVVSHATPFASRPPATFKSINARTFFAHMFDSLCHLPEGCKLKNTWLLCYAPGFGAAESQLRALLSDSTTCTEMWHTTANCLRPPAPHASAVSLNPTLAVCTQADTYRMGEKQKQKDAHDIYKLLICHVFLVILKTED